MVNLKLKNSTVDYWKRKQVGNSVLIGTELLIKQINKKNNVINLDKIMNDYFNYE